MRYRLRTLLILLAVGPPILAGLWLIRADFDLETAIAIPFLGLSAAVIYAIVSSISWILKKQP